VTFDKTAQFTGFVALAATSFLGSATAATAANVTGCGLEPDGGNLENISGVCELTFDNDGSYSWTLPAGIAGLHAIIVGGGGGAEFTAPDNGYSGAGGGVYFVDLTGSAPGDTISGNVGGGGTSDDTTPTWGGNTTLSVNGGSNYIGSGGGAGSMMIWGFCFGGVDGYWGENLGAGTAGDPNPGGACTGGGPGKIPDTDGSAPAIFDGYTTELGRGGSVLTDSTPAQTAGRGANILLNSVSDIASVEATGADGLAVFRYTASDANNVADSSGGSSGSLANTGNEIPVAAVTLASIGLIAAGLGATMFARRRSDRS
jgi:hypothetical protein